MSPVFFYVLQSIWILLFTIEQFCRWIFKRYHFLFDLFSSIFWTRKQKLLWMFSLILHHHLGFRYLINWFSFINHFLFIPMVWIFRIFFDTIIIVIVTLLWVTLRIRQWKACPCKTSRCLTDVLVDVLCPMGGVNVK